MSNIFFTADQHYSHANIIRFCNRPFSSIEEMDEILIQKWNKKIGVNDTTYCLGDFAMKDANAYANKLNGKKIFTTGDHDSSLEKIKKSGIITNYEIHIKQVLRINYKNCDISVLHWLMAIWPKSHYGSWHCFGHSHGRAQINTGKSWDVGVDANNYEPVSFDELHEIMKNRPDNPNLIKL